MKKISDFVKKHPIYSALIINLAFLIAVILFGDMKYEVSDDFVMDTILSGAYGAKYDAHLLFSNMILGYGLKLLYMIFPVVSWYFVMHIVLCFMSLTVISAILMCKKSDVWGIFLTILFVSFFSDDLYLLVQFTKTATVCIMAGGLLVLYSYWNIKSKKKYLAGAFGIVLCLIGAMVRSACINMVLPFLVLVYIGIVIKQKFDKKLMVKAALGVALCGLVVLGAYKLWGVDRTLWISLYIHQSVLVNLLKFFILMLIRQIIQLKISYWHLKTGIMNATQLSGL